MPTKKKIDKSAQTLPPETIPEHKRPEDTEEPGEPVIPEEEDPEMIPDEDPFENPAPYTIPEPGEGP